MKELLIKLATKEITQHFVDKCLHEFKLQVCIEQQDICDITHALYTDYENKKDFVIRCFNQKQQRHETKDMKEYYPFEFFNILDSGFRNKEQEPLTQFLGNLLLNYILSKTNHLNQLTMAKSNLVTLAEKAKLAPNSKAAKMLKAGNTDKKELATALLTTAAYKNNAFLKAEVDSILTPAAKAVVEKAPAKSATRSNGEPR